jgi:hypothetical protein
MSEFITPPKPEPRVQVQPKQILGSFGLQALKTKFYGINDPGGDDAVGFSFGNPVFSNIDFIGTDDDGRNEKTYTNLEGERVPFPTLTINTVLFSVNQSKNIVKTPIQGRNGTVKEYISDGDFDIQIRGLIVSDNANEYPKEDVRKLVEILRVQDNLEIASRYLEETFDITNIVIESYSLPQTEGYLNVQAFEINAVSDDPIELTLNS